MTDQILANNLVDNSNQPLPTHAKDQFLATMIRMVEDSAGEFTFGIMLLVHGAIISGLVVPQKEYADNFAFGINQNIAYREKDVELDDNLQKEMHKGWVTIISQNTGNNIIHLRDVIYVPVGDITAKKFPYWRINIHDVNGWTLGQMKIE